MSGNLECLRYAYELIDTFPKQSGWWRPRVYLSPEIIVKIFQREHNPNPQKGDYVILQACIDNCPVAFLDNYIELWHYATTIDDLEWLKSNSISGIESVQIRDYNLYSVEAIEWIYNNGRIFDAQDIGIAICDGNIPVSKFLLEKNPIKILDANTVVNSSIETIQWLMDYGFKWLKIYTEWSLKAGRLDIAQWLWKKGILFLHLEQSWKIRPNVKEWLDSLE